MFYGDSDWWKRQFNKLNLDWTDFAIVLIEAISDSFWL